MGKEDDDSKKREEAEKTAINLRGRAKSALTRIFNYINNPDQLFQKHDLCNKLEKIENIFIDFDKADAQLPIESSELEEFEEKYYETKAKLQAELDKCSLTANNHMRSSVINNDVHVSSSTISTNFKLPRIHIEKFRGSYTNWIAFRDLYISLVHNNDTLSNIQKFQYLTGLLAEEPASIIKHIPISENSYLEAWDKLLSRYDRKKQIVSSLIKTFLDQPTINYANATNIRTLTDTSDEVIRGLKSIDSRASDRDVWLIHLLLQKLDSKSKEKWYHLTSQVNFPTFEQFISFLNDRCLSLELCNENDKQEVKQEMKQFHSNKSAAGNQIKCIMCKSFDHYLYKCDKYKKLSVKDRKLFVRKNKLCLNCLSNLHLDYFCKSSFKCHFCNCKHHSSLCENKSMQNYAISTSHPNEKISKKEKSISDATLIPKTDKNESNSASLNCVQTSFALLPTANVYVKDSMGQKHIKRVMADSGSESTFILSSCVKNLGIKRNNARFPVKGLSNQEIAVTKGYVMLDLHSIYNDSVKVSVKAFILDKLTAPLPTQKINEEHFSHLKNVQLADPQFEIPRHVDIILGSDYFFSILLPGQVNSTQSTLIAQNSIFGFLVSGKMPDSCTGSNSICNLHIYEINIDKELKRFWEMEEIVNTKDQILTPEEQFVESHFQENYSINSDGRFVVKLPFYKSKFELGNSRPAAISRLFAMEKKFKENSEFEKQYKDFMREYELLGHMEPVQQNFLKSFENEHCFLPHHAVMKPSSTTTKLRIVFDASCKTSSGASLNSVLGVGPKLQRDIFEILLNFRFPEIVFSADMEKMYRQIQVFNDDQNYQLIAWRYNLNEEIKTFKLKTVTYGLAPASFLATKCIQQAANDYTENPRVSQILLNDVYMDDLLSGLSTVEEAIEICREITNVLHERGFHLRKWNSNSSEFLSEFQECNVPKTDFEIVSSNIEGSKVLGLFWNSSSDTFVFKTSLALTSPLTKRHVLSQSARIFDPLGLISPCTVVIKIFYQKLWLTKGDWDSPIPQHLADDLFKFQTSFNEISQFSVPRCVALSSCSTFQLHGFADASTLAYAAAIYCRQTYNGKTSASLLVSKTKVAPIKQISVPKLELCGAHLLSKLFRSVMNTLSNYKFEVFAWTDSKVVLSWLSAHPRKWKTFVANRTSQITEVLPTKHWGHVPTKQNPADIASRGIDPKCLPDCSLWWNGPSWLLQDSSQWPKDESNTNEFQDQIRSEQRSDPIFAFHARTSNDLFDDLFEKYSSLSKIIRILAYCKRLFNNRKKNVDKSKISLTSLTFPEIKAAEQSIVLWVQGAYFREDLRCISEHKNLPKKSQLQSLYPFIDENGVLRVGGRLQNSQLTFNHKHPVILPAQHKISELLIKQQHIFNLHAGPSLLSHIIKQSYWIIGGKRLINKCVNKCLKCYRFKRSIAKPQLMGNLPEHRVTLQRAFFSSGVDYAGPIQIKFSKGRGAKTTKGYIALFVCLATKAVHIEAVSDLTAETFLAALTRFSSRRGAPRHLYSDNATNFVGASRKLNEVHKLLLSFSNNDAILAHLTNQQMEWHFIPPASPHFGGIWEAAIRSTKHHLKRVIGETILTFEELCTLLTQVEALLNSRPISHINDNDIDSINVLTPSHFISGDVLTTTPADNAASDKNLKARWQILQNLKAGFAKRFRQDYLSSLQQRSKWKGSTPNLKKDDVVLLLDDRQDPSSWPLGRVMEVHPGSDGLVRVATVKTKSAILKRSVQKLALIPYQD